MSSKVVLKIALAIILIGGLLSAGWTGNQSGMKTSWEYRVVELCSTQYSSNGMLNQHGADGWELVSVAPPSNTSCVYYYFKRVN
jgi:hypothetical protein